MEYNEGAEEMFDRGEKSLENAEVSAEDVGTAAENAEGTAEPARKPRRPIRVSLGSLIVAVLLTALLVFQATFVSLTLSHKKEVRDAYGFLSSFPTLLGVKELFEENYLYDIDLENMDRVLADMYIYASGDPYLSYYTAEEWAAEVQESTGHSVGIGVYIAEEESGTIAVTYVMSDSPALAAGLQAGDRIIAVEGTEVAKVGYERAVALVKGEIGTTVSLSILRDGKPMTVNVERGKYASETVIAKRVEKDGKTYAHITLTEFAQNTVAQFKTAVNAALSENVAGIVFDLRDNLGGDLDAVCSILDFLLPKGPIVHIYNVKGEEKRVFMSERSEVNCPMTVLVNGNSASGAELFSAALRDYDKATLIGTKTYGKGCGQSGYQLPDGSILFFTDFLYTPPTSDNYDGIGLMPDIVMELPEAQRNKSIFLVPTENDTQLAAALSALAEQQK